MNRFQRIIDRFILWGTGFDGVYAALVIGSQTREDHPADEFSDLDLVLIVDHPASLLQSDQWLEELGEIRISFVEDTIGGAKERRVLFEGTLDVDFVILSLENLDAAIKNGEITILNRGYRILIDKIDLEKRLSSLLLKHTPPAVMSEDEFHNVIQDFWFHAVWSAKKWMRGELWTAKACVDGYMKARLLNVMESYARAGNGAECDTWHNGRFVEEWTEGWVIQKLSDCYARYDRDDIRRALFQTMELFRQLATGLAVRMNYEYPEKADLYASEWVKQNCIHARIIEEV